MNLRRSGALVQKASRLQPQTLEPLYPVRRGLNAQDQPQVKKDEEFEEEDEEKDEEMKEASCSPSERRVRRFPSEAGVCPPVLCLRDEFRFSRLDYKRNSPGFGFAVLGS